MLHLKKPPEHRQHEQLVQVAHLSASAKQHSPTQATEGGEKMRFQTFLLHYEIIPSFKYADLLVQQEQCTQGSPVADQQRTNSVQHGQELHQPRHSQDGALLPHAFV